MRSGLRERLACTPPGYRFSRGRVLFVYSGLMVVILLAALDQAIVSTALPHITGDIGGVGGYSGVFSAYLLALTVTIPVYGKLGDNHGRRPMIFIALGLFLAGSICCGLARTMPELIIARGLQGVGAGGLMPLVQATIADMIPPRDRGRYIGLSGASFGAASILGPVVGGLIVDHASWRWVFFMNVPLCTAAIAVIAITMPRIVPAAKHAIDYAGAVLLAIGVCSLFFALTWRTAGQGWGAPHVLAAFGVAAGSLLVFWARERRVADTILPFQELRIRPVAIGAAAFVLIAICQFGAIAYIPLFAQGVIGVSATSSGVVLIPLLVGIMLSAISCGFVISKTGRYRVNAIVGPVVFCAGLVLMWRMGIDTTALEAGRNMLIVGIGIGIINPVFTVTAQNAVPHRVVGSVAAFMQFTRSLGMSFGATLFGLFIVQRLPSAAAGGTLGHRLSARGRIELTNALHPAFAMAMGLGALLVLLALFGVKEIPLRASVLEDAPDAHSALEGSSVS